MGGLVDAGAELFNIVGDAYRKEYNYIYSTRLPYASQAVKALSTIQSAGDLVVFGGAFLLSKPIIALQFVGAIFSGDSDKAGDLLFAVLNPIPAKLGGLKVRSAFALGEEVFFPGQAARGAQILSNLEKSAEVPQ